MTNRQVLELLDSMYPTMDQEIPYFWDFKPELKPEPSSIQNEIASIIFGMHGHEIGPKVLLALLPKIQKITHHIRNKIQFMIGNPAACKLEVRKVKHDSNRLLGENPEFIAAGDEETLRIEALKPKLRESSLMIDVHSPNFKPQLPEAQSGGPTAFLMIPEIKHRLAHCIPSLEISTVLTGPALWHPSGEAIESDQFVAKHGENGEGGLGMTLEAWCENEADIEEICNKIILVLVQGGFIASEALGELKITPKPVNDFSSWNAYKQVFAEYKGDKKSKKFRFRKAWKNFEFVRAGTTIAKEDGKEIIVEKDSRILFAKPPDQIVPGNQVCLLLDADPGIMAVDSYNRKAA